jgi:hypothetical protein
MDIKPWGPDSFLPWVEGVAVHLGDPVDRLRFLNVATPCARPRRRPRGPHFPKLFWDLAGVVFLILAFTMTFVWFEIFPAQPNAAAKTAQTGITLHRRIVRNPTR